MRRRLAAAAALGLFALAVVLALVGLLRGIAAEVVVLASAVVGVAGTSYGIVRRGPRRVAGLGIAVLALVGVVLGIVLEGHVVACLILVLVLALSMLAARDAFAIHASLPRAPAPEHPVLFFNPLSGGGKASEFHLAEEARARGIKPIELRADDSLESLVRDAVADGADALAMAGGDGSQAIVAAMAADAGLPYACIPAGTRNHFALDLGVDRDDVVGALDAFVDGGERRVDLAEVNGRVFVNNVSLGIYATAVQRNEYRDAKLRTLLDMVPDVLGPDAERLDLRWRGPGGREHRSAVAILISNNRYRLGRAVASGTRPRIDAGVLGVVVVALRQDNGSSSGGRSPWRQWTVRNFEVTAGSSIPAGIDGEAAVLDSPLRFSIRPAALRVRISHRHPGASPSVGVPDRPFQAAGTLFAIAAGRGAGSPELRHA